MGRRAGEFRAGLWRGDIRRWPVGGVWARARAAGLSRADETGGRAVDRSGADGFWKKSGASRSDALGRDVQRRKLDRFGSVWRGESLEAGAGSGEAVNRVGGGDSGNGGKRGWEIS